MLPYSQLQQGVEANQIYYDHLLGVFRCTDEHFINHRTPQTDSNSCKPTCPFRNNNTNECGLPKYVDTKLFYLDKILQQNPEYLI